MTIDERIQALTFNLELESRLRIDAEARHETAMQRHEAIIQRTDRRLDRAVKLAVKDALRQRKRNAQFDAQMVEIRSLHADNSRLLKAFLERGTNGHTEPPQ